MSLVGRIAGRRFIPLLQNKISRIPPNGACWSITQSSAAGNFRNIYVHGNLSKGIATLFCSLPILYMVYNENEAKCSANSEDVGKGRVKITDIEAEMIAKRLREMVDIPGIPDAIERPLVEQVIKAIIHVTPLVLPEEIFNRLIAGDSRIEGVTEATIRQINDEIYIPIISRDVQKYLVEKICKILFDVETDFETVRRQMVARALREVFNADSRVSLATALNENVDIPLVSEENEQIVAEKLVDVCFDILEAFIPTPIRDILESTSPEELYEVRNNMVDRLAERIDIPFANEEEERKTLRSIVDFFLSFYGLSEGTKTPAEQLTEVEYKLKCTEIELEAFQEVSKEKIKMMKQKRAALEKKRRELTKTPWLRYIKFW